MKPLLRFTIKMLTKNITWILILSILVNATGLLFPSAWLEIKQAKAVDASDYMYLYWTNCASPPSGWTVVSDGAGEAFYDTTDGGLFPRGNSSYARYAGGASTHTHSSTVATTGSPTGTATRKANGSTQDSTTHSHTGTASVDSKSTLPAYKDICVIKYDNGIPNGDAAIPQNAVAVFDAAPPAGWSDYSGTFGTNFVRGNSTAGGTGGSNTHAGAGHTVSSITLDATGSGTVALNGTGGTASPPTHTHTVNNQTSNTPDTQPPYIEVYLGQKSTAAGPIPNGMIAMFDDTDSSVGFAVAGWTRLSDSGGDFYQRFIKVTGAYGSPSGAAQHTHTLINAASNAGGGTSTTGTTAQTNITSHTHSTDITLADGTNTNLPPYTDVVFAKKQTAITALTTDKADYPTLGETITVDSTVNNYHASTNLSSTRIDYVVFEDTGTADGRPTAGETYVTNNCAGSGAWASGNYTHQTTGVNVSASASTNDQWQCANSNFPNNTAYTLWARWWDGSSYAYNIYFDKGSVTFSSIPTLGQILFIALIGIAVYFGYRQGVIKLRPKKKDPNDDDKDPDKKDQDKSLSGRIGNSGIFRG